MIAAIYERLCTRAYALVRAKLAPDTRNSQYIYREALSKALQAKGLWLDLGCGHDFLPSWMSPGERALDLEGWITVGIDKDPSSIARHRELRWRVLGDVEQLPFRDRTFNLITANMVLEHVLNPVALFREIGRVLQNQGVLIIHTPNGSGYTTVITRLIPSPLIVPLARLLLRRERADVYPAFYRANSIDTLKEAAREAGLSLDAFRYLQSSPQLARLPPLMAVELMIIRLLRRPAFAKYRACILATFEKSPMKFTDQKA
jgi:SAM-dependent methyltransferase